MNRERQYFFAVLIGCTVFLSSCRGNAVSQPVESMTVSIANDTELVVLSETVEGKSIDEKEFYEVSQPVESMTVSIANDTEPVVLSETVEGKSIDEKEFYEKGAATGTIIMTRMARGTTSHGPYYVYPIYPISETTGIRGDEVSFSGQSIRVSLYNSSDPELSLSGTIASLEDFSYIRAVVTGLTYVTLNDGEIDLYPDMEILFTKTDGSFERCGIVSNGSVLRALGKNEVEVSVYTEISEEPLTEIVLLHLVAEAFRWADCETGGPTAIFRDTVPLVTGIAAAFQGKTTNLSGDSLEAFIALCEPLESATSQAQQKKRLFFCEDKIDEGIRFVLLTESRPEADPMSALRFYGITKNGELYFEQRNAVLLQSIGSSYYINGLSMVIGYPQHVDYEAAVALLGDR